MVANKERHRLFCAAYVILLKKNSVLLVKRFNTGYQDGLYSLPAGHLEKGETFVECAIREAFEEVGARVKKNDLHFAHALHRVGPKRNPKEYIDLFFKTCQWSGNLQVMEPDKCSEIRWFLLDKLPDNTQLFIRNVLQNLDTDTFYGEDGWLVEQ